MSEYDLDIAMIALLIMGIHQDEITWKLTDMLKFGAVAKDRLLETDFSLSELQPKSVRCYALLQYTGEQLAKGSILAEVWLKRMASNG